MIFLMLLKEAMEEYLFDCESRLAKETVKNYGFNLKGFINFLFDKGVEDIESIQERNVKQYSISLQKQNYQESYINTQLTVIKGFLSYLQIGRASWRERV